MSINMAALESAFMAKGAEVAKILDEYDIAESRAKAMLAEFANIMSKNRHWKPQKVANKIISKYNLKKKS